MTGASQMHDYRYLLSVNYLASFELLEDPNFYGEWPLYLRGAYKPNRSLFWSGAHRWGLKISQKFDY